MKKSLTLLATVLGLGLQAVVAAPVPSLGVAQVKPVHQGIRIAAAVEAVTKVQLSTELQARVTDVLVNAGDRVKAGQLLAKLDDRLVSGGVSASAGQLNAAKAQLANAEANLKRTRQLVAQQFVSKASLDTAQANFDAAQATVQSLSGNLGQTVAQKAYSRLVAPFEGVVSEVNVEKGTMAAPGVALLTLFDPSKLRVVAHVSQSVADQLSRGAAVKWQVGSGPWQPGGALTLLPAADATTHTREIRMSLPAGLSLSPGQSISLWLTATPVTRLVIPASGIIRRGELTMVNVMVQNKRELRMVRLGNDFGPEGVEVLAGLSAGERIVLTAGMQP